MKNIKKLLLVSMWLASATLFAQSAFEGSWRFSPQSAKFGGKPDTLSLQNGVYRCDSCVPRIEVKADGKDQKVSGSPF